jgi:hypothetical protein
VKRLNLAELNFIKEDIDEDKQTTNTINWFLPDIGISSITIHVGL